MGPPEPIGPTARHVAIRIDGLANAIKTSVLPRGIVDHEHDKVAPPLRVWRCYGDAASLIFPREPARYFDPGGPFGDIAICIELFADAVEPTVLLRRVVDHEYDKVAAPIAAEIGNCYVGPLILR